MYICYCSHPLVYFEKTKLYTVTTFMELRTYLSFL
jgi:hypothetical protein